MTPVMQTIFAARQSLPDIPVAVSVRPAPVPGNCLQAAIASLLDLPLDEVPHFVGDDVATDGEAHWWTCWLRWCEGRGLTVRADVEPLPGEYFLGGGPSPRDPENVKHVAVYRDGLLVHDPHPDGTGVVEVLTRWTIRRSEHDLRELAYAHRDEVVEGSGVAVEPWRP